jgi:hypothetical protein
LSDFRPSVTFGQFFLIKKSPKYFGVLCPEHYIQDKKILPNGKISPHLVTLMDGKNVDQSNEGKVDRKKLDKFSLAELDWLQWDKID